MPCPVFITGCAPRFWCMRARGNWCDGSSLSLTLAVCPKQHHEDNAARQQTGFWRCSCAASFILAQHAACRRPVRHVASCTAPSWVMLPSFLRSTQHAGEPRPSCTTRCIVQGAVVGRVAFILRRAHSTQHADDRPFLYDTLRGARRRRGSFCFYSSCDVRTAGSTQTTNCMYYIRCTVCRSLVNRIRLNSK